MRNTGITTLWSGRQAGLCTERTDIRRLWFQGLPSQNQAEGGFAFPYHLCFLQFEKERKLDWEKNAPNAHLAAHWDHFPRRRQPLGALTVPGPQWPPQRPPRKLDEEGELGRSGPSQGTRTLPTATPSQHAGPPCLLRANEGAGMRQTTQNSPHEQQAAPGHRGFGHFAPSVRWTRDSDPGLGKPAARPPAWLARGPHSLPLRGHNAHPSSITQGLKGYSARFVHGPRSRG